MAQKKLDPKLRFTFNIEDTVPILNIEVPLKKENKKKESIIIKSKRNGRDSSTSSPLF